MFFRRLRTLADQYLGSGYIPDRAQQQLDRLSPSSMPLLSRDAYVDAVTWGYWADGSPVPRSWSSTNVDAETMERAVNRLLVEWLPERRLEVFQNTPDLPGPQLAPVVRIGALDFDPISDDQDQEFLELLNLSPTAVDVSGWTIADAVSLTLPAGTVIPAGGSLFLSPNKAAFLQRDLSPTGGEQRFVLGPYSGNLAAEGETIELYDELGVLHDNHTFSGRSPGFNGDSREDRDGDGLNALMEWALGFSDEQIDSVPVPVDGTISFTVRSNLNGFELLLESSEDLNDWRSDLASEISRVPVEEGLDRVTFSLPENSGPLFVRFRLMQSEFN